MATFYQITSFYKSNLEDILLGMDSPDQNMAKNIIINPYSAISFHDYLFDDHKLNEAKEDWVLTHTDLIAEIGPKEWLDQLLIALATKNLENSILKDINPHRAIMFSKNLRGKHNPKVKVDVWVSANIKLMKELGTESWLWQLLDVLENGVPLKF